MATPLYAQVAPQLIHTKQFSALNGTIDFLPGAWVRVRQDGHPTYYSFRENEFRPADPPDLIRQWQSFDWQSIDFLNQIAIQNYDPDLNQYLPKDKRVKRVVDIPLSWQNNELILVCFTKRTTTDKFSRPRGTDVYLVAVLKNLGGRRITYKLLWTKKVAADASYGNLMLQNIPNLGRFLVLYWASIGGSGGQDNVDIYRFRR